MGNPAIFETARLRLRSWREGDREPFARMNADPRVMEFFPACLSRAESDLLLDRIQNHFTVHGFGLFALEMRDVQSSGLQDAQEFIGFTGLSRPNFAAHFTPCVEIGWRLMAEHWGKGLATEAALAAAQFAFEVIALPELVSFTVPRNVPSRRVMEKIGMTHNPLDDFDHPGLPESHPLGRQVLYRLSRSIGPTAGTSSPA